MGMPGFTAEASMYPSTRYYRVAPSAASVRDGGLVSMAAWTAACSNPIGTQGCYPDEDGDMISICPCGSQSTGGPCFDLTVDTGTIFGTVDLGMQQICKCTPSDGGGGGGGGGGCRPCSQQNCCGDWNPATGQCCNGPCKGPGQSCP